MFFLHLQSCFKIEIAGKFNLGIRARATHPNIKIRLPVRRSNICWLAHTDVNSKFLLLARNQFQTSTSSLLSFLLISNVKKPPSWTYLDETKRNE